MIHVDHAASREVPQKTGDRPCCRFWGCDRVARETHCCAVVTGVDMAQGARRTQVTMAPLEASIVRSAHDAIIGMTPSGVILSLIHI